MYYVPVQLKKLAVLRKISKHLNATNLAFIGCFLPNIWSLAGNHLLVKATWKKKELKPGAAHTYPLYIVSMQVISFRIRMATDERTRSELSHYIKNSMIKGLELLFIGICTLFINLELGSRECDMIPAPQRVRDIPFHRPCLIDYH